MLFTSFCQQCQNMQWFSILLLPLETNGSDDRHSVKCSLGLLNRAAGSQGFCQAKINFDFAADVCKTRRDGPKAGTPKQPWYLPRDDQKQPRYLPRDELDAESRPYPIRKRSCFGRYRTNIESFRTGTAQHPDNFGSRMKNIETISNLSMPEMVLSWIAYEQLRWSGARWSGGTPA